MALFTSATRRQPRRQAPVMKTIIVTRSDFLDARHGQAFADHWDPLFDDVLAFFGCGDRQRRMEEAEIHHDRAPLAGVIRDLEALPALNEFFAASQRQQAKRLRQVIGLTVRLIMERRGWTRTGRNGSMGVRAENDNVSPHNSAGLSLWFPGGERFELPNGMPYQTVSARRRKLESASRRT